MKKILRYVWVLGVVGFGCTSPNQNEVDTKMEMKDKEVIEQLLANYQQVLNASDARKAADLYTKDGVFMPSNAPSANGSQEIRASYEFVFSQIELNVAFYIEEIMIEHTMAFAITTSKGTTLVHATGETIPEENRELFVFEKENEDWKISRYMFNKMN